MPGDLLFSRGRGLAMRGKQLAITAAVALVVVIAYKQYEMKKGR